MKRKIIVIHTASLRRLTPQVVEILRVIGEEFKNPELVVYVNDWSPVA